MSSHSHPTPRPRATPLPAAPWLVVGALIAAAVIFGFALITGTLALVVIGAVLALAALVAAAVLARRGAVPSFTHEFPEHTWGPRATTAENSGPPIDTQPHQPSGPADYQVLEEKDPAAMEEPPDDQRVFPQYTNLGPDERLRNVEGHEVIERSELEAGEETDTAEPRRERK